MLGTYLPTLIRFPLESTKAQKKKETVSPNMVFLFSTLLMLLIYLASQHRESL